MKESKFFSSRELSCSCCGGNGFDPQALSELDAIRAQCGFPFILSSAYRCAKHPVEAAKQIPGEHTSGMAVDVLAYGERAYKIVDVAFAYRVQRIGISQKGDLKKRFIHLGFSRSYPYPRIWSY